MPGAWPFGYIGICMYNIKIKAKHKYGGVETFDGLQGLAELMFGRINSATDLKDIHMVLQGVTELMAAMVIGQEFSSVPRLRDIFKKHDYQKVSMKIQPAATGFGQASTMVLNYDMDDVAPDGGPNDAQISNTFFDSVSLAYIDS
jgi:hypothetical protein